MIQSIRPYLVSFARERPRAVVFLLLATVFLLFAANVARSYYLNQFAAMYDNPVYRWRESMAIALSRLQNPPLHGYLAYRSISNYLNQHGLGLMAGEADPLPGSDQIHALVFDGPRIEALIRAAATVPIDASLPPVILHGNERGLADFYDIAFRIFGIHVWAFTTLYFVILAVSAILFFLTFRGSPFCLLLLMLYLLAHFYMLDFSRQIEVPHNSRFFPGTFVPGDDEFILACSARHASQADDRCSGNGANGNPLFRHFDPLDGSLAGACLDRQPIAHP